MMRQLADACLVAMLVFLHRQLVCSATGCVQWSVYRNQNSNGALRTYDYESLSACQNYCVQTDDCVAVEFVTSERQCWTHTDVDNLAPQNTRTGVPDVTQYRLDRTCSPRGTTPAWTRVCRPSWRVMNDTNALGAKESDAFTVPDVETCLTECMRTSHCVAVDVNVNVRPAVCWPHYTAADLKDDNIFSQTGTNLYQLTGSCASNCVPQWIRINDTNADGATAYFNVTSEDACLDRCLQDLRCVAVDVSRATKTLSCWPHFQQADILHTNLYSQPGTSLLIPVKRCIASLYWVKTTSASAGIMRPIYGTTTTLLLLLLLSVLVIDNSRDGSLSTV